MCAYNCRYVRGLRVFGGRGMGKEIQKLLKKQDCRETVRKPSNR